MQIQKYFYRCFLQTPYENKSFVIEKLPLVAGVVQKGEWFL